MTARPLAVPGAKWRWLRRTTQTLTVLGMLVAPVLGGWQRTDRAHLATVADVGWNLPKPMLEWLPNGEPAALAYEANRLLGGGSAADYLGVPATDPVLGALALLEGGFTWHAALAILLPTAVALTAGRVFCGWFCAFGVLARAMDRLSIGLPFLPRLRLPRRRPLRFAMLAAGVAGSIFGVHLLLYLSLPYLLLQQSVYAAWLLGGGSLVLSVLLGLLAASLLFGPTLYCASLCPTGAALGTFGRARVVRLQVINKRQCGSRCGMCNTACWLQLSPRDGDPGPDCDLCGRCVPVCPKANLHVVAGRDAFAKATTLVVVLLAMLSPSLATAAPKPSIVVENEVRIGDTTVAVSVLDVEGTLLDSDWGRGEHGIDVSVYLTRGALQDPDEDGIIAGRPFHRGPLTVTFRTPGRAPPPPLRFDHANHPISAQRPSIYRAHMVEHLQPGDRVVVQPVPGYLEAPLFFVVSDLGTRASSTSHAEHFAISLVIFSGLLSLALVIQAPVTAGRSHPIETKVRK